LNPSTIFMTLSGSYSKVGLKNRWEFLKIKTTISWGWSWFL